MSDNEMFTWSDGDQSSKETALSKFSDSVDSYTGLHKTQGNHYRHFIDITKKTVKMFNLQWIAVDEPPSSQTFLGFGDEHLLAFINQCFEVFFFLKEFFADFQKKCVYALSQVHIIKKNCLLT